MVTGRWCDELPLLPPAGFELRVTDALPQKMTLKSGEEAMVHWFPMYDYVLVSRELWEKLKMEVPTSVRD